MPADLLPDDQREREQILQEYVCERVPDAVRDRDMWEVRLLTPPRATYYIDPRLREGLSWWAQFAKPVLIRDIPFAFWRRAGVQVSLSDAWTLASWSRLLASHADRKAPVVVLHVDDHEDLMSPRLVQRGGTLVDLISGKPVDIYRPATVNEALQTGAIGMGSFIVPLLASGRRIHIRHLRMKTSGTRPPGHYRLVLGHEPDTLLAPHEPRPVARIAEQDTCPQRDEVIVGDYTLTHILTEWISDLPADALLMLHVDCDYFNNRYDGDSDWRTHSQIHDPPAAQVQHAVEKFCEAMKDLAHPLDDITIALSPGFFPAEYWLSTVETLLRAVNVRRPTRPSVSSRPIAVRLVSGKGSPGRGGGPGGSFWHVYDGDRRAGSVWINQSSDSYRGKHASLVIELNEASRGKTIGRRAYRLAAEASEHDEIWLHMRRTNIASRKAAEHAGFAAVDIPGERQLVMRWRRTDS